MSWQPHPPQAESAAAARRTRLALVAIPFIALVLRLGWVLSSGWPVPLADPDDYTRMTQALADGHHPWRWTFEAVRYFEFYRAPLYQLFLSLFTAHPNSYPLAAVIAHALLDSLLCLSFYWLGRSLHSARAGLVAAAVYALWAPRISMIGGIRQEQLFLPLLVTGFACLASAVDRDGRPRRWMLAGAVLGLAALTRSSVAYFVMTGALLHLLMAPNRPRAWRQCVWWVGTFVLVVAPYTVLVSAHAGRFMLVEDIGYFNLKRGTGESGRALVSYMADDSRGPTAVEAARYLAAVVRADPVHFAQSRADYVRLILKPLSNIRGIVAGTPGGALALKWVVHAAFDAPFVLALLLAPLGVALARRREIACLLSLWVVLYLVLVSVTLWAGGRWRLPIEPPCIALAAVVVAGEWARPSRIVVAVSAVAVVVCGMFVAPNLPDLLAARANYGVRTGPVGPESTEIVVVGRAGVNVITAQPFMTLTMRLDPSAETPQPTRVVVRISGRQADELLLDADQPRRVRYAVEPGLYFLELAASTADGSAATVVVSLP